MNLLAIDFKTGFPIVAAVLFVVFFAYGALRRVSRMSWGPLEALAAYGLVFPLTLLPIPGGIPSFVAALLWPLAAGGAVLGASGGIRGAIRHRKTSTKGSRAADIVVGGLVCAVEGVFLCLVLFAAALVVAETFVPTLPEMIRIPVSHPIYQKFGKYAFDYFFVFALVYALKGGYRLGVGRFLWVGLTLSLGFFAVFGALLLVLEVPFLTSLAGKIAGACTGLPALAARILGIGILALIIFLLFLAIIIVIDVLVDRLFVRVNRVQALNIIAGIVQAVLFYLAAAALFTGLGGGIAALFRAAAQEGSPLGAATEYLEIFLEAALRSPFIAFFHGANPLPALLG